MQPLIIYLLKLAFCLALGYLFYFLLLRRMTYYTWNRFFLLSVSLAALAIPLLPVQLPEQVQQLQVKFFITDSLPVLKQATADNLQQVAKWNMYGLLLLLMLTGMLFFLVRFAVRLYSLHKTRCAAQLVNDGDVKLYHLPGGTAPFSFYNSIYLDTHNYDEADLEKIIEHEMVHITQKHTMDLMLCELLCIVQWFNPFVWLMKYAIKQNLEFIADDSVLQKGINRKGYQYLLLKVSGAMPYSLANNLLFPSLKKRIHMMNRAKTGRIHLLKFMCIVPLGCLLLFAFSGPVGKAPVHDNKADAFQVSSIGFYINDENVATIVKNDQQNSLLQAGGPLSLLLISNEKERLQALLSKNGYNNLDEHAISFVMDTVAAKQSFSVLISIKVDKTQKQFNQSDKSQDNSTAIKRTAGADIRYSMAAVHDQNNRADNPAAIRQMGKAPVTVRVTK